MMDISKQIFQFDKHLAEFLAKITLESEISTKTERHFSQVAKHLTKTGKRLRIIFFNTILSKNNANLNDNQGIYFYLMAWIELHHIKQKFCFDYHYQSDMAYGSKNLVSLSFDQSIPQEMIGKIIDFFLLELENIILSSKYSSKFKIAKNELYLSQIKSGTIFNISDDISLAELINYYNLAKASEYRFIVNTLINNEDDSYDLFTELAINFALYSFLAQIYTNYFGNRRKENFAVMKLCQNHDLDILTLLIKLMDQDKVFTKSSLDNLELEVLKELAVQVGAKSKLITFSYQFKANFIEIAKQLKISTDDLLDYV